MHSFTVISSAAGQPTIGKPLIGQARGQLRLTWRSYAGSPQSREISYRHASPLHWPHSIELNAGSFLRWQSCIGLPSRAKLALSLPIKGLSLYLPDRDGAGRSPEDRAKKIFLKFFSFRGSKNQTFCDINNRGMKRPHEMMYPISKRPFSTSAVRRRAGE